MISVDRITFDQRVKSRSTVSKCLILKVLSSIKLMQSPSHLYHNSIAEIFFQVWRYGMITRNHRQQLCLAILGDAMNEEECHAINRLFHAVRRGWLKLID